MEPKSGLHHFLYIASSALLATSSAHAASGTWLGLSGDWSDPAIWASGTIADGANFTANFTGVDISDARFINLNDARTIGNIIFTDTATSSHDLTIFGENPLTLDRTDATQPTIHVTQAGRALAIDSVIDGSDGMLKTGEGLFTLGGANEYTGMTTVSAGGLILTNLSSIPTASPVSVANSASLQLNAAGIYNNTSAISITGDGLAGGNNPGAIFFADVGGSLSTLDAPLTLVGATTISSFGANMSQALGGPITGSGSLTIDSRGGDETHLANWELNAASTYSGNTLILNDNGLADVTVKLGVAQSLPTTTVLNLRVASGVPVDAFATLDLNGFDQTLAGLRDTASLQVNGGAFSAGKRVINSSGTPSTLTISNSESVTYGSGGGNVFAGTIGGTTATGEEANNLNLTKTGSGILALGGANTYLNTTISAGILQIGGNPEEVDNPGGVTGSFGSGSVLNNAAVSFNRNDVFTLSNVISGSGTVSNIGLGTLEVAANNSYSGGTSINSGTLLLRTDLGGQLGSGEVTVAAPTPGSLGTNYQIWAPSAIELSNDIVLNGATGIDNRAALNHDGGEGKVTLSGTVTLNATSDIGVGGGSSNSMDITGVISGAGGLIVDESNVVGFNTTLTLAGANTYEGGTSIIGGNLRLGASNVIPDTSAISIGSAPLNAATLDAATAGTETAFSLDVTDVATITLGSGAELVFTNGGTASWAGSLNITGDFLSGSSLNFGSNSGLTPAQLGAITLNGDAVPFSLDSSGFLISVGAPTGFAAWQAANATAGGINDDHDNDGVSNGIEYFLESPSLSTGFTQLPSITRVGSTLSITWTKGPGYDGIYNTDFVVQTSATLADPWITESSGTNVILNGDDVTFTFPEPLGSKKFARIEVTSP